MVPCCRIFESYCESMGVELMHMRFLRGNGERVQGSELLMDLKLQDEEIIVILPGAAPNAAENMC